MHPFQNKPLSSKTKNKKTTTTMQLSVDRAVSQTGRNIWYTYTYLKHLIHFYTHIKTLFSHWEAWWCFYGNGDHQPSLSAESILNVFVLFTYIHCMRENIMVSPIGSHSWFARWLRWLRSVSTYLESIRFLQFIPISSLYYLHRIN